MSFTFDPDFINSELLSQYPDYPVIIHSGYSLSHNRMVVYKVIEETPGNARFVQAVEKEARTMMKVKSPNICEVLELKKVTTYCCVVMERMERDWLTEIQSRANSKTHYKETELWTRLYVLVCTLAALQQLKIAHRDIKPANVFLTSHSPPRIKLADFDSCKVEFAFKPSTLRGTVAYLSPKLYRAYNHNESHTQHDVYKSDVYSLGVTMIHAMQLSIESFGTFEIRRYPDMDRLSYSETLKSVIRLMLTEEEENRPDFLSLADHLHLLPSLDSLTPLFDSQSQCVSCASLCTSVPCIELPCRHLLAACSRRCLAVFSFESRQDDYIRCSICRQRYRYSDFVTALPALHGLYSN